MESREEIVRDAFYEQASACMSLGSPFTAAILRSIIDVMDNDSPFGSAVLNWPTAPGAKGDAVPLRVAGALQALATSNKQPRLSQIYPPNPLPSESVLKRVLRVVIEENASDLMPWLHYPPQTNEVGRASLLFAGLMHVGRLTSLPLAIHEIGASAGLNLILDRYVYELGERVFGNENSTVRLKPVWAGVSPAGGEPNILSRAGCDVAPLDVTREDEAARLMAYIWADQHERRERVQAAIDIFRAHPVAVEREDAKDWIPNRLGTGLPREAASVLVHSLTFTYLPDRTRKAVTAYMETIGRSATASSPLAWVSFELHDSMRARLAVRIWPDGAEEVLAEADPHGRWVTWLPTAT